jgi:hypothetical protein
MQRRIVTISSLSGKRVNVLTGIPTLINTPAKMLSSCHQLGSSLRKFSSNPGAWLRGKT